MIKIDNWVQHELTKAAEEAIREHLWSDITRCIAGEGITFLDRRRDAEEEEWIARLDAALSGETVREVWAAVSKEIESELAEAAKFVVPHEVVQRWLNGEIESVCTEESPERQVLRGLQLLAKASSDRDLADQLGLS